VEIRAQWNRGTLVASPDRYNFSPCSPQQSAAWLASVLARILMTVDQWRGRLLVCGISAKMGCNGNKASRSEWNGDLVFRGTIVGYGHIYNPNQPIYNKFVICLHTGSAFGRLVQLMAQLEQRCNRSQSQQFVCPDNRKYDPIQLCGIPCHYIHPVPENTRL
jgi:hypothetical protein